MKKREFQKKAAAALLGKLADVDGTGRKSKHHNNVGVS